MLARALLSLRHPLLLWASRATGLTDSSRGQTDQRVNAPELYPAEFLASPIPHALAATA